MNLAKKPSALLPTLLATAIASSTSFGALSTFSEDFEGLNQASPTALGDAGWLIFANVFGPGKTPYLYGYGPFAAPNVSGGFSNVTTGEGGPPQGDQGLVVFSDYNNSGDHGLGRVIESNVFQEQTIGAGDTGDYIFQFDAKAGDLAGASTALAFIKVLDPGAGFALTRFETLDTTALPATWGTYQVSVNLDASLNGQILQFGFANDATSFEPSGVFYDNVSFVPEPSMLPLLGLSVLAAFRRRR